MQSDGDEFPRVPCLDQAYTPSHPYPPVQDVAIHKRVSLRVVLANFKVGVGQESTFCYREPLVVVRCFIEATLEHS